MSPWIRIFQKLSIVISPSDLWSLIPLSTIPAVRRLGLQRRGHHGAAQRDLRRPLRDRPLSDRRERRCERAGERGRNEVGSRMGETIERGGGRNWANGRILCIDWANIRIKKKKNEIRNTLKYYGHDETRKMWVLWILKRANEGWDDYWESRMDETRSRRNEKHVKRSERDFEEIGVFYDLGSAQELYDPLSRG